MISGVHHVSLNVADAAESRRFYVDVLGFEVMPRPDFPFPGYWLGINGKIQVHMGPAGIPNQEMYYLGTPTGAATDHAGVVDHIAFLASNPQEFVQRFKARGMSFRPRSLPESELFQLFIKDPNGLTIELNFFGIKEAPDWGGEDYSRMERVGAR